MMRSDNQAVKFKRRALGWSVAKLAAESKRTVEEIRRVEDDDSSDKQLIADLLTPIDSAITQVLPYWEQVISDPDLLPVSYAVSDENKAIRRIKLIEFGKLLRDRRNQAQLSRIQLGKLAKLSDATIKFIETARHPPSRRTCQALVGIKELKLKWEDVEKLGYVGPAPTGQALAPARTDQSDLPAKPKPVAARPSQADSHVEPAPAPAMPDQTNQDSSAAVALTSHAGEVIEEEIFTFVRRTIRKT